MPSVAPVTSAILCGTFSGNEDLRAESIIVRKTNKYSKMERTVFVFFITDVYLFGADSDSVHIISLYFLQNDAIHQELFILRGWVPVRTG